MIVLHSTDKRGAPLISTLDDNKPLYFIFTCVLHTYVTTGATEVAHVG